MSVWRNLHDWKSWRASNLLAWHKCNSGARFAMSEPKEKSSGAKIIKWVVICIISGLLVAIAIPNFIKSRATYSVPACINNLHWIDSAKNQWAVDNNKTNGTVVTENDIMPYLKGWSHTNFPECPSGGTYTIGKIGEPPICSLGTNVIPAHVLP
jgi:general secretion pathway protein G